MRYIFTSRHARRFASLVIGLQTACTIILSSCARNPASISRNPVQVDGESGDERVSSNTEELHVDCPCTLIGIAAKSASQAGQPPSNLLVYTIGYDLGSNAKAALVCAEWTGEGFAFIGSRRCMHIGAPGLIEHSSTAIVVDELAGSPLTGTTRVVEVSLPDLAPTGATWELHGHVVAESQVDSSGGWLAYIGADRRVGLVSLSTGKQYGLFPARGNELRFAWTEEAGQIYIVQRSRAELPLLRCDVPKLVAAALDGGVLKFESEPMVEPPGLYSLVSCNVNGWMAALEWNEERGSYSLSLKAPGGRAWTIDAFAASPNQGPPSWSPGERALIAALADDGVYVIDAESRQRTRLRTTFESPRVIWIDSRRLMLTRSDLSYEVHEYSTRGVELVATGALPVR